MVVCVCVGAGEAVPLRRLLQTILRLRACTDAAQWEGDPRPRTVPASHYLAMHHWYMATGCAGIVQAGFRDRFSWLLARCVVWARPDRYRPRLVVCTLKVGNTASDDGPPLLLSPRTGTRDCVSQTAANEQPTFAHIFPRTVQRGNWRQHTGRAEST